MMHYTSSFHCLSPHKSPSQKSGDLWGDGETGGRRVLPVWIGAQVMGAAGLTAQAAAQLACQLGYRWRVN